MSDRDTSKKQRYSKFIGEGPARLPDNMDCLKLRGLVPNREGRNGRFDAEELKKKLKRLMRERGNDDDVDEGNGNDALDDDAFTDDVDLGNDIGNVTDEPTVDYVCVGGCSVNCDCSDKCSTMSTKSNCRSPGCVVHHGIMSVNSPADETCGYGSNDGPSMRSPNEPQGSDEEFCGDNELDENELMKLDNRKDDSTAIHNDNNDKKIINSDEKDITTNNDDDKNYDDSKEKDDNDDKEVSYDEKNEDNEYNDDIDVNDGTKSDDNDISLTTFDNDGGDDSSGFHLNLGKLARLMAKVKESMDKTMCASKTTLNTSENIGNIYDIPSEYSFIDIDINIV